ncbi:MAG: acyl-CoA dehydrogenase family protein [Panacagrimonas sp.]
MNSSVSGSIRSTIPADPGFITLPPSGLEAPLTELQTQVIDSVRRFARDVMRPIGIELDRMSPEEVIAEGSPLWTMFSKFQELGLTVSSFAEIPPEEMGVLFPAVWEELGYGDGGLAISIAVFMLPHLFMAQWGRPDLFAKFPETQIGCWGITEPDHGSDILDADGSTYYPGGRKTKPNLMATLKGDKVILNGQKSAWVSNGTIAQHCLLYTAFDRGADKPESVVIVAPLNLPGVTKGKPLDKIGQRALNQGEIYFNNVEIPAEYIIAMPEQYNDAVYAILAEANSLMGCVWTGAARAAYELARDYAHTRKQGGAPIHQHQNVKYRLLHMFRQVEVARAISRRAYLYNHTAPAAAIQGSICAKITATQAAFDVASMAIQMFGGNGLTKEYPVEKLLRDARASMIEDGCNEMLAIKGGARLIDPLQK